MYPPSPRVPDVSHVDGDVQRETPFVGDVPRLDRTAVDVTGLGRAHGHRVRKRQASGVQIGERDRRDALVEPVELAERLVLLEVRGDRERILSTHRPRPRQRVVGDAVSRTEHVVVVQAVDGSDARREIVFSAPRSQDSSGCRRVRRAAPPTYRGPRARCRDRRAA